MIEKIGEEKIQEEEKKKTRIKIFLFLVPHKKKFFQINEYCSQKKFFYFSRSGCGIFFYEGTRAFWCGNSYCTKIHRSFSEEKNSEKLFPSEQIRK